MSSSYIVIGSGVIGGGFWNVTKVIHSVVVTG
jgi:hypothetical protein